MKPLATTRMSSKGQVVIPEEIRKALKLTEGKQFVVLGEKDVIILKIITPPSMKNFDHLITQARKQAGRSEIKKSDIQKIIKKVRKKS
ncbi:MAG: AbrB/MazE/SpoVT family DNA-binding domain-containing protein [Gammaproteobacteria bacterium]|nr:AbrB/MazE/SpoVT family DNA-binding domain-containing protein [Gammaproteobacteria bacterium]MCW5583371.1 AbrB/MazE/SpoVT family DNA-binding domain-containing protein [Gammaproteobacteria bacterium]